MTTADYNKPNAYGITWAHRYSQICRDVVESLIICNPGETLTTEEVYAFTTAHYAQHGKGRNAQPSFQALINVTHALAGRGAHVDYSAQTYTLPTR